MFIIPASYHHKSIMLGTLVKWLYLKQLRHKASVCFASVCNLKLARRKEPKNIFIIRKWPLTACSYFPKVFSTISLTFHSNTFAAPSEFEGNVYLLVWLTILDYFC